MDRGLMHAEGTVLVRLYAELGRHLPPSRRGRAFEHRCEAERTVRELLASLGVAPGEVEIVLLDGEPASLDAPLRQGVRVAVYPVFESLDVAAVPRPRSRPLRRLRFAVDPGLAALADLLVARGFAVERAPVDIGAFVESGAVLLTRNPARLAQVERGYRVQAARPAEQLAEVLARFELVG